MATAAGATTAPTTCAPCPAAPAPGSTGGAAGHPAELPSASATLAGQKFGPTPLAEAAGFVARLGEVDPRPAGVQVTELAPSLFQLEATGA